MMQRLFSSADEWIHSSDWKDIAILKFCLLSLGLLAGMAVPEKKRVGVRIAAAVIFTVTYIPLMMKYLNILLGRSD